ncbi:MAG TPA: hypothetical protein VHY59_08590, partial [Chthoniobacterales bacterium]|nr:hypothetical protein [Chthoniobacterales bacterium]
MTWTEFQALTMAELEALEARRSNAIRHSRFNAALVSSAICNANRSADSEPISPFDFIAGFERDEEDEEKEKLRRSVKKAVVLAFGQMRGKDREYILAERAKMVSRMELNGIDDPDGL